MLAVLAGCSGMPEETPVASSPSTIGTTSAPAPAASVPPAGPLGSAAYQAELTKLEQSLAGPLRTLTRVRTAEGLTEAMTRLADSLNAASSQLADLTVTTRLTAVHEVLQDSLGSAAEILSNSDRTEANARCGGVAYTSQKVQRQLPDPGPAPKAVRPSNGAIVIRSGPTGTGRLKVTNGTANDVAVSIVTDGKPPAKPHVMTYIQAGKAATISRIGGAYHVYFKSGTDWNATRRQFGEDCSFQKFEQAFGRNESWQVNLEPTLGGNAKTTEVEAY